MSASHNAASLVSLGTSYQASQVLFESVRLGLFQALGAKALSAGAVSRRLGLAAPAAERLLRVLVELGLVMKKGTCYVNAPAALTYLCPDSPLYMGDFFLHRRTLQEPWSRLHESLRSNGMVRPGRRRLNAYARQLQLFTAAMNALGRLKCGMITERLALDGARCMLDLGGGIGTYAAGFCRLHPALRAVVFDLPDVARLARRNVKKLGLHDRISVVAGQCLADRLPQGPFDLVFISNLLHIYNAADCRRIVGKAAAAAGRGGTLAVHDYMFGCGDGVSASLFDLSMLVGTPQGRCYERSEIARWLRAAGIRKIQCADVFGGTSVLWGVKS